MTVATIPSKNGEEVTIKEAALLCGVSAQAIRNFKGRRPGVTMGELLAYYRPPAPPVCACGCGTRVKTPGDVVYKHKLSYYRKLAYAGTREPTEWRVCANPKCRKKFPVFAEFKPSMRHTVCCRACGAGAAAATRIEPKTPVVTAQPRGDLRHLSSKERLHNMSIPEPTKFDRLYGYGPEDPNHEGRY